MGSVGMGAFCWHGLHVIFAVSGCRRRLLSKANALTGRNFLTVADIE